MLKNPLLNGTMMFNPDYAVPPGETIKEILFNEFAENIDQPLNEVEDLITGEYKINDAMADKLAKRFPATKQFWLNLEKIKYL